MTDQLHTVTFNKILQGNRYTIFILSAKNKKFPIYTNPQVGEAVSRYLTDRSSPRPQTYDFINSVFTGLEIRPLQLVLKDIDDTIYYCDLLLEQTQGNQQQLLNIDTRPSDGLVLALTHNLPIYCTDRVLEKTPEFAD